MKKVFLRISLAVALSFGVKAGFAQQQADVQTNSSEQAVKAKMESVVVKKKVMSEAELKEAMATGKLLLRQDAWYEYDGVGDLDDPTSYNRTTYTDFTIGSLCPTGTARLCAIKVLEGSNNDGEHPDEDALQNMVEDIENAIGTGSTSSIRIKPPAGN